ncbi:MAG: site-2 protease family protein [Desulfobacteraceae bacterium]|nr:site-2 protease family protein [Desulfobacteraceae bacterium]
MIVPLLLAVTIHEAAHGYVAYRMGDDTAMLAGRLTLNPIKHLDLFGSFIIPLVLSISGSPFIFGYAKPVPVNFTRIREYRKGVILVSGAGVVANMACAVASGILFRMIVSLWHVPNLKLFVEPLATMLVYSVTINLLLAVFNLIPVPPLDGSRILGMFLPEELKWKYESIERYGMLIIIVLLMTGIINDIIKFSVYPLRSLLLG